MVHYIVHGKADSVGVAVVDVRRGQNVTGWNMESDATLRLTAAQGVPLGHKIALTDIAKGAQVIKYGEAIGRATKAIGKGQHVHTHNLGSARW